MRKLLALALLASVTLLLSCGGGNPATASAPAPAPPAPVAQISISPTTVTISVLDSKQFAATVTGVANTAVTWSVAEASGGAVDATGKYVPPMRAGTYHVVATAQADTTKSASAAVTVTAPAPVVTTTAPGAAKEAVAYSYTLAATDPANTAVTFTLTTSPVGASLNGNTLTWTPTPAQARFANGFTVTATTAAGGTATQSWSVTPIGTIHGSWIDTYWDAHGTPAQSPHDLSDAETYPIVALMPQNDGSLQTFPGTGKADGTFTIPNVPGGYCWLQIQTGELYWTNSSTFDRGTDMAGRLPSPGVTTTMSGTLTNLDPWNDFDWLQVWTPNCNQLIGAGGASCGMYFGPFDAGATAVSLSGTGDQAAIDASQGDVSYLIQEEPISGLAIPFYGQAAGPALTLPALTTNADGTTDITGTLTKANPQTLDVAVKGSSWAQMLQNMAPSSATLNYATLTSAVYAHPFVSNRAYDDSGPSLVSVTADSAPTSDVDAGTVQFNNPFPGDWVLDSSGDDYASVSIPVGEGTQEFFVENWYEVASLPTGGFAPQMSPIQNPRMNGASLFTAASSNTTAATLSWSPPTGLAAFGYEVEICLLDTSTTPPSQNWTAILFTPSTSLTVPPGILTAGNTYFFLITALADGHANMASSPYRSGFPRASVDVQSAPLTISAGAFAPPIVGNQSLVRHSVSPRVGTSRPRPLPTRGRLSGKLFVRQQSATSKTMLH